MPALLNQNDEPLTDAAGNELRTGQTITDIMFGDGIVRGTVPIEKGLLGYSQCETAGISETVASHTLAAAISLASCIAISLQFLEISTSIFRFREILRP